MSRMRACHLFSLRYFHIVMMIGMKRSMMIHLQQPFDFARHNHLTPKIWFQVVEKCTVDLHPWVQMTPRYSL